MATLTTIQDLNNLGGDGVLLACLKIEISGQDPVYLVNNRENITFNGNEFIAFPFKFGEITSGKGEVPQFNLQVDNTSRAVNRLMMEYDIYLKQNGIEGNKVIATIYVINTIDLTEEILAEKFELTSWDSTTQWATFKMGASNPFMQEYPRRKMYANFCGFKFKGSQCGYTGAETVCDKTLTRCRELNNSVRFGGFKGLGA